MSKEEAMLLPLKERPICYRLSSEMYMAVWDAIGAATNCGDGTVEHAEKASDIVVNLLFKIADEVEKYRKENEELKDKLDIELMTEECSRCKCKWSPSLVEGGICIFCILKETKEKLK